jgi:hypothetical protein
LTENWERNKYCRKHATIVCERVKRLHYFIHIHFVITSFDSAQNDNEIKLICDTGCVCWINIAIMFYCEYNCEFKALVYCVFSFNWISLICREWGLVWKRFISWNWINSKSSDWRLFEILNAVLGKELQNSIPFRRILHVDYVI